jgi:hypothetical protein
MKLDILANTIREMIHSIIRKDELVFQRPQVPLVPERTKSNVPKHFPAHPWYHGLDKECFMYSIHNIVKDEIPTQLVEEPLADMMCMFDDISFMVDLPTHDQYDEDDIKMKFPEKLATYCWEEEDHLQSQQDSLSVHSKYDSNDQSAENIRVSGNTLPLCFSSFEFLKGNSRQVVNSEDKKLSNQSVEDAISDIEVVADSEVHPLSLCAGQNLDENTKPGTGNELIHFDSPHLCFSSFQTLKGNVGQILVEDHSVSHEMPTKQIPQSSKIFYDPIANMLDRLCFQSQFSFTPNDFKKIYDMDTIRQSATGVCSTEASFQNPSEKLQPCQEVHEDANSITMTSNHEVELVKFEYPIIGEVYLDPMDIYMEKLFIREPQCIPSISIICHVYQASF